MNRPICLICQLPNQPDSRFCEGCGRPLSDNTTRYLCAAVHQDAAYCDAAIAEFLIEPVRAVPPSPGADSGAVLHDAVAARYRRKIRDLALLVLLLVFVVTNSALFVVWLLFAALGRVAGAGGRTPATGSGERAWSPRTVAGTTVLVVAGLLVIPFLLLTLGRYLPYVLFQLGLWNGYGATPGLAGSGVVLTVLLFAVLVTDALAVHWLVHSCFRRDRFTPNTHALPTASEASLRNLGVAAYRPALDRVARSDRGGSHPDQADVVVHRGFNPFVGAGVVTDWQSVAISLVPDDEEDGAPTKTIDVRDIHEWISSDLQRITPSSSLGPGGRLAGLVVREQVLISSRELLSHPGVPPQREVLPRLDQEPAGAMHPEQARALATAPAEWARYYRCYRIETWDRDFTTSCFVHIGADDTTLYLERAHCQLMPLTETIRQIDRPPNALLPWTQAVTDLFLLPATVPMRIRTLLPVARQLRQRPGEVVPDRYGAARSLRELASDRSFRSYFQMADASRYQRIVDRVIQRAVGAYLEEHGYSAVEFQRAFNPTLNDFRNATINNSAFGPGARAENHGSDRPREQG